MRAAFVIFILGTLFSIPLLGQWHVEAGAHRGFLLPHRQNMRHLPVGPANALEVRVYRVYSGEKNWHQLYRQPEVGLTIRGMDLANHQLLGYGIGVAPYFSSSVVRTARFRWNLEMGAGLGWTSKKFEFDKNYKNVAIGSHLNAFIVLGQRFSYQLSPMVHLSLAMSFNHFSNASYALPNLGLNYPLISLATGIALQKNAEAMRVVPTPVDDNTSHWTLSAGFGVKETYNPRKKKFPTLSVTAERCLRISRKSLVAPGVDVFYNSAIPAIRKTQGDTAALPHNAQAGVHFAYQLRIDDFYAMVAIGSYVFTEYKADGYIYNRVGFRYYPTDHVGIQLTLKTHFFKADFFELGAAYRF